MEQGEPFYRLDRCRSDRKGIAEACKAGELLKENGFNFDKAYTSYLKRAVKTLNCVLDRMDQDWIPVEKSWRLNEKHYGDLQGLNKSETAAKYGDEQVLIWRRSYDIAPNALSEDDPRNPRFENRYRKCPMQNFPDGIFERYHRPHHALLEMYHFPESENR